MKTVFMNEQDLVDLVDDDLLEMGVAQNAADRMSDRRDRDRDNDRGRDKDRPQEIYKDEELTGEILDIYNNDIIVEG